VYNVIHIQYLMHFDIDAAKIWSRTHLSFAHAPEDYFLLAYERSQPNSVQARIPHRKWRGRGRGRESDGRRRAGGAGGAGASPLFIVLKSLAIVNLRNSCKYAVVKRAVRACTVRS